MSLAIFSVLFYFFPLFFYFYSSLYAWLCHACEVTPIFTRNELPNQRRVGQIVGVFDQTRYSERALAWPLHACEVTPIFTRNELPNQRRVGQIVGVFDQTRYSESGLSLIHI